MSFSVRANGKLLLTGEYVVLKGAKSLCLPTKFGQSFQVEYTDGKNILVWKALTTHKLWFEVVFSLPDLTILSSSDTKRALTLQRILKELPKEIFQSRNSSTSQIHITTHLEFSPDWGLGSSSTLIYCLSRWAKINPYELLQKTFGGSGYDIACADANTPIFYSLKDNMPFVKPSNFHPNFKDQLFFIHLNKKQNSQEEVRKFQKSSISAYNLNEISEISHKISVCSNLQEFEQLIEQHEHILSIILQTTTIKQQFFSDYHFGVIKSLGAWGGDFILATGEKKKVSDYFTGKGFPTILSWDEMILND